MSEWINNLKGLVQERGSRLFITLSGRENFNSMLMMIQTYRVNKCRCCFHIFKNIFRSGFVVNALLHNSFSNTYLSRYNSDFLDYQCQHTWIETKQKRFLNVLSEKKTPIMIMSIKDNYYSLRFVSVMKIQNNMFKCMPVWTIEWGWGAI